MSTTFIWFVMISLLQAILADSPTKLEYRIQNGYPARPGEFPSIVLLTGRVNRCTGTLIAPNKIITAGHCACGDPMITAYANITSIDERNSPNAQIRNIIDYDYPTSYSRACRFLFAGDDQIQDRLGGSNDIAIITTDKPFRLRQNEVEVADLPDLTQSTNNPAQTTSDAIVLGFGRDISTDTTGYLRFGYLKLTPCPNDIRINTSGALCASIHINYQNPDAGDSGGPIINSEGQVIGVVSISGSGWIVFPNVYSHVKFLKEIMN